ncbi:MAG TPA: S41 family peptidase [Gemmatimonadales bacterium]|nr:S41 family peptidase [Gemmatimonadales bacterium]
MPSRIPLLLLAAVLGVRTAAGQQLSATDRARMVATLWSDARYNYAYWDRVAANWDSGLDANLTLAAQRQSDVTFWRRLETLAALLNDGQAAVVPPVTVRSRTARPPIRIRAVEGRPFVADYAENDELRIARPSRGFEIVSVQGVPAATWIRDSILPGIPGSTAATRWERAVASMLVGERGTPVQLALKGPAGVDRGASLTRSIATSARSPFEPLPLVVDTVSGGITVVHLNSCADAGVVSQFDRTFAVWTGVRAVILDLRENDGTGGGRESCYRILARLMSRPFVTSRWRTPEYRPAYRGSDMPDSAGAWFSAPPDTVVPRPDLPAFNGPVALLSSARTAGAGADLLVAFRNAQRGPIVGEPSAGGTGQVLTLPLSRGWFFRVTVTRDAFPDGSEFAATGIAPEMAVTETVADFQSGKDAVLERAVAFVRDKLR